MTVDGPPGDASVGDWPFETPPASARLPVGTVVRLIRPVSTGGCYFAEGRRGKVIKSPVDAVACTVEFDDVYHTVAEIAGFDLAPLAIAYVREFSLDMLHWLNDHAMEYRLPRGALFSPVRQHPLEIVFERAEDMARFCAHWAASVVPAGTTMASRAPVAVAIDPDADDADADVADANARAEAAERAANKAKALALRQQASLGGLRFDVYLPPGLAEWVLDLVARGVFDDPSEAVFIGMTDYRELTPHTDLRQELMQRMVQAAIDDPRPPIEGAEVFARLQKLLNEPLPEPAIWPRRNQAH